VDFVEFKLSLEQVAGLSQDALHIYAALVIQIVVAAVSRRGVGHAMPWLCVLAAELANEWMELRAYRVVTQVELLASLHDVWNTMLLPTLLLILARVAPWLLNPEIRPR
jgi:hypothetical protein